MSIYQATTRIGYLLTIIANGTVYNFQNITPGQTITTNNKVYNYAPIDYTPPSRALDSENTSTKVKLPNFPEILQAVEQNDGFRNAIVQAIAFFPDDSNANPYASDLLLVASSKISGGIIEFDLQSPFNATTNPFPNVYFTTGNNPNGLNIVGFVPEVPVNNKNQVN